MESEDGQLEKSGDEGQEIKWNEFENDDQVKAALKKLVFEMHLSGTAYRSMPVEEVRKAIQDHLASKGMKNTSVSVSEPNAVGQRMVMGMAHSPLTGEVINF